MKSETINVLYTCGVCTVIDQAVSVRVRYLDESVESWMDTATRALMKDHWTRSPNCNPGIFKEVKIPIDGTDKVGGPQVN